MVPSGQIQRQKKRPLNMAATARIAGGRNQRIIKRLPWCASREDKKDRGLKEGIIFAIHVGSIMTSLIKPLFGWNILSIQTGKGPDMRSSMATMRKNILEDQRTAFVYLLGILSFQGTLNSKSEYRNPKQI